MSRPRRHEHMPGATTGIPRWEDACGGAIQAVYIRKGTPTAWLKWGEMCIRCHAFWPTAPATLIGMYRERQMEHERRTAENRRNSGLGDR